MFRDFCKIWRRAIHKSFLKKAAFALFVLGLGSAFAQDFFKQANELYDKGEYKQAVKMYRAAIQDGRYEPFAWFNLGNTLVQLKKNNIAIVAYKRTVELMPDFAKAWILLGDLYYLGGDFGLAIAAYYRALELGEESDHIHYALGECFIRSNSLAFAQKHFEKATQLNPDRIDAWYGLAEVYEKLGDYEYAIRTLKRAVDNAVSAGADVHYTLSHYYSKMDSSKKAIREMESGLLTDPRNTSARRFLAQMYLQDASPWMAIFTLEEGLRFQKDSDRLHVDLGQIYFAQKRYDEALEHYMTAWKMGNSQGRIGAENVGNTFYNAGDEKKAQEIYLRIIQRR
ncbi:MAG: tetratricopeptide repeat protein [Fibrobacter intestinalis]|nr:tetratricopeptide repeat protein [Fibrobacter intestinalis]